MKILKLIAENFKRITAVEISPKGDAVVIGGPNEAGKSSTLDSIMVALAGTGAHPPKPVKAGAKQATIKVDIGDEKGVKLVVKKEIKAKGTVNLVVENAEGEAQRSPQTILDALVGTISFDPSEFCRMKPKDQIETLRTLVPELDFTEVDAKRSELYEDRRVIGRQAKEAAAVANDLEFFPNAPEYEADIALLTQELERRIEANQTNNERREFSNALQEQVEDLELALKEAEKRLKDAQAGLERAKKDVEEGRAAYEEQLEIVKALEDLDVAEVREQIASAKGINDQISANRKRKEAQERSNDLADKVEKMTAQIAQIDEDKKAAIESAQFPVDGLGFGEDGVTFNGVPFEQASQSERWRASIAIGIAMNPTLRVMLIREGALLDDERLSMVAKMAKENDVQLWIEDVGDGRASVVIEDGSVRQ